MSNSETFPEETEDKGKNPKSVESSNYISLDYNHPLFFGKNKNFLLSI